MQSQETPAMSRNAILGLGLEVEGFGFRVWGLGFVGCMAYGVKLLGCRVPILWGCKV